MPPPTEGTSDESATTCCCFCCATRNTRRSTFFSSLESRSRKCFASAAFFEIDRERATAGEWGRGGGLVKAIIRRRIRKGAQGIGSLVPDSILVRHYPGGTPGTWYVPRTTYLGTGKLQPHWPTVPCTAGSAQDNSAICTRSGTSSSVAKNIARCYCCIGSLGI